MAAPPLGGVDEVVAGLGLGLILESVLARRWRGGGAGLRPQSGATLGAGCEPLLPWEDKEDARLGAGAGGNK